MTPGQRGQLLYRLSELFYREMDTLAAVEALDNGKAFNIAKGDVAMSADCLKYYGGWADKVHGKAEVIIGKQRHGPTGTVEMQFDAAVTRFSSLARENHVPERI